MHRIDVIVTVVPQPNGQGQMTVTCQCEAGPRPVPELIRILAGGINALTQSLPAQPAPVIEVPGAERIPAILNGTG